MKKKTPRLRRIDNVKFESMYSERDALQHNELRVNTSSFEDIEPFLCKLPPKEIDFVTLYRKYGKNQKDIAKMFNVTQGAISSRLKRANERLKFLRDMPKISDEDIDNDLKEIFDKVEIEIIKTMKETTCQSATAVIINEKFGFDVVSRERMTQVKVRHRFEKCLNDLAVRKEAKYVKYYELLVFLKNNLYKLHEVKLPHFSRGDAALFTLSV